MMHVHILSCVPVFGFGVVLYEIFAYGRQPWHGYTSDDEIIEAVVEFGDRSSAPRDAPAWVCKCQDLCFVADPESRANFSQVVAMLNESV